MASEFRNSLGERIFDHKYRQGSGDTWANLARRVVNDVCGDCGGTKHPLMSKEDQNELVYLIKTFKFIPGGRYLYYAGRQAKFYNNCYLLRAEEDTREEWANVAWRALSCLSTGGGIGIDYSVLRPEGYELKKTGGKSSGPIPLMKAINEIGRCVMQGGTRRSAIYASLNWQHEDIDKFLHVKDWETMPIGAQRYREEDRPYTFKDAKMDDFNFPCPLDMTNISVNYDNAFLEKKELPEVFIENVRQAMRTGEPGFSFNFGGKENETLRNALTSNSALNQ